MEDGRLDLVRETYRGFYRLISDRHITTEKQASAAALILTADSLATENLFCDGRSLRLDDILPFLTSQQEVDQNERAYDYIMEIVAMNAFHFSADDSYVEKWGWMDQYMGTVCINRTIFGRLMADGGFDARGFLSWAVRRGIVRGSVKSGTNKVIPTKLIKRNGVTFRYVEVALRDADDAEFIEDIDE